MQTVLLNINNVNHEIVVKEFMGKRVVTFKDIDELHQRPEGTARKRFNDNKRHFVYGEDYFVRNSDEARNEFGIIAPNGLVLITESGYLMLVKSFTDDLAWHVQRQLVNNYFRVKQMTPMEMIAMIAQQMVEQERQNAIRDQKISALENGVRVLTTNLTAVPEHTKVIELVNEYARWTRMGHNEVYNTVYKIMQAQYGIDVRTRVENERQRINEEHYRKTGKYYAESTLKKKVNGIDIMVRMGCLDKFHKILVGLLAKAKGVAQ
ncbi:ORF6N domain-containing protein [Saccharococcus caldoxylosilyticus]|uniref:KilA-N DNA-binding domain-containing protein n=1 Tax=Saccharococcus caldoxylosilyticus TaxID=81408 RepID=A0A150LJH0_9BACL|nr:ORF6N domain-containing protein [Parageobacillus caldoxylosilyticus]KYD12405.1 hypothetical protein B4119_2911 [Parageobacillus caldoxylosilyticus]